MNFIDAAIRSAVAALCYRIKGGLLDATVAKILGKPEIDSETQEPWGIPNFYIRAVWAMCVTFHVITPEIILSAPLIFAAAYLGVAWGYFGKFSLDFPQNRNPRNYFWLTIDGMCIMLPVAVVMTFLDDPSTWLAVLAGALFVPCYLLGNFIHKYVKIQGPTQYGEILLGGVIGLFL